MEDPDFEGGSFIKIIAADGSALLTCPISDKLKSDLDDVLEDFYHSKSIELPCLDGEPLKLRTSAIAGYYISTAESRRITDLFAKQMNNENPDLKFKD